jgi:hypothetical protein
MALFYKEVEVEIEVDLSEFETKDLVEELASRRSLSGSVEDDQAKELLEAIWLKRRIKNDNYQEELDQLIYQMLGHVV